MWYGMFPLCIALVLVRHEKKNGLLPLRSYYRQEDSKCLEGLASLTYFLLI